MARTLVVDEFLEANADWRHLALEDIEDPEITEDTEEDVFDIQRTFMTMIACECAKEASEAGHHVIITCHESELLPSVYSEIEDRIVSVFLGNSEDADGFDHVIDSGSKSMVEISQLLNDIIEAMPA